MRQWWSKLSAWMTGRAAIDDELAEEVRSHVEMEAESLRERGMSPETARAAAQRRFGNATAVTERAHDAWTFAAFESLLNDIRYGYIRQGNSDRGVAERPRRRDRARGQSRTA